MTKPIRRASLALLVFTLAAGSVSAGQIESACNRSNRDGASRALCSCIQNAADMTLRSGDQRRAASFFKDPEKAQKAKMSDSRSDDAFWERYQAFASLAEAYCTVE